MTKFKNTEIRPWGNLTKVFFLSLLFFSAKQVHAQDPNLHIYLCFGQSNMSGQGPVTEADKTVDSRFKVLRAGNHSGQTVGDFYPAVSPLGHSASQLGPADFFGRKMVQLVPQNVTVAVANIAIGGQSIDLFNKATSANYIANAKNSTDNNWWIQYLDEYGGDVYQRIIEMGQIAKQQGVIKGILFHQGEADYNDAQWGNKVKKVYEDILKDLSLNGSEVPFLMGELLRTEVGGDLGWRNDAVAAAAAAIPNGHLISAADCPMLAGDQYKLHFSREGYKILGERYATTMFELLAPTNPGSPVVSITAPLTTDILFKSETIEITASATDSDGQITAVEFFVDGTSIGTDATEPYNISWIPLDEGEHIIKAVATDNESNESSSSININVLLPQQAFGGTPWPIPGKIETEDYDLGGQGFAFNDKSTSENQSGTSYRDDIVDIEVCSEGGYNLSYTEAGEWYEYTVLVDQAGKYNLLLRVACDGTGRKVHIDLDDVALTGNIDIPNTGGWQTWQTITVTNINLEAGEHILKLTYDIDYANINHMTFELKDPVLNISDDQTTARVQLYPNPTNNFSAITVQGEFDYQVYTLSGMKIESGRAIDNLTFGQTYKSGVYIIHVKNETGVQILKFTKK